MWSRRTLARSLNAGSILQRCLRRKRLRLLDAVRADFGTRIGAYDIADLQQQFETLNPKVKYRCVSSHYSRSEAAANDSA
jgi:hypothetical protein